MSATIHHTLVPFMSIHFAFGLRCVEKYFIVSRGRRISKSFKSQQHKYATIGYDMAMDGMMLHNVTN